MDGRIEFGTRLAASKHTELKDRHTVTELIHHKEIKVIFGQPITVINLLPKFK